MTIHQTLWKSMKIYENDTGCDFLLLSLLKSMQINEYVTEKNSKTTQMLAFHVKCMKID